MLIVSSTAIQLAKMSGHSPIVATASPHNTALLTSLGATHVIPRTLSPSEILSKVRSITSGTPIPYVYDAVSLADTQSLAYEALAPGGVLVIVLADVIPKEAHATGDAQAKRVVFAQGNVHFPGNEEIGPEVYKRLTGWLKTGVVKVSVLSKELENWALRSLEL